MILAWRCSFIISRNVLWFPFGFSILGACFWIYAKCLVVPVVLQGRDFLCCTARWRCISGGGFFFLPLRESSRLFSFQRSAFPCRVLSVLKLSLVSLQDWCKSPGIGMSKEELKGIWGVVKIHVAVKMTGWLGILLYVSKIPVKTTL